MKFKVTGTNRDNGARMILEFEAESKAAAERKASQSGMSVNRVENITDGYPGYAMEPRSPRRGNMMGIVRRLLFLLAMAAVAYWWFFMTHRGLPVPQR